MALTGNKGEWSEIYTLFKLLGDKQIYSGDGNLNRIEDLFYPIIKILRQEDADAYTYSIEQKDIVFITENGIEKLRMPVSKFKEQAEYLLQRITSGSGTFSIPKTESFMHSVFCQKIKASSHDKTDIHIMIHDLRTGMCPNLGFSIKSRLGNSSTLINSSMATNFTYEITGVDLSHKQIYEINSIDSKSKIRDKLLKIKELGGSFHFIGVDSDVFNNNLVMIDSCLPQIVSELLLLYFSGEGSRLNDLVQLLQNNNPIGYNTENHHKFYEYKIKRLLSDAALGMIPATVWTGIFDANGGYLVVKEDGDILCYHLYNRNEFESYLLNTSYIDTPSSERHGFGSIIERNGKLIFKLNLQVRFL